VMQISLSRNHRASDIRRKNYSQTPSKIIEFNCFYVESENGVFLPTKELKLGFLDRSTAETLQRAINLNGRGI
jgi:hypothetical protein